MSAFKSFQRVNMVTAMSIGGNWSCPVGLKQPARLNPTRNVHPGHASVATCYVLFTNTYVMNEWSRPRIERIRIYRISDISKYITREIFHELQCRKGVISSVSKISTRLCPSKIRIFTEKTNTSPTRNDFEHVVFYTN